MSFSTMLLRLGSGLAVMGAVCAACEPSSTDGGATVSGVDAAFEGSPISDGPETSTLDASSDAAATDSASADANAPDAAALLDVYVDPIAGLDTNLGKAASPFKTIKKALSVVPAGSTVWLADGSYNAANQGAAALLLPDGARVSATHVGLALLEGTALTASSTSGALLGVVLTKGSTLTANDAVAAAPTFTLTNVEFRSTPTAPATLSVGGNTKATLTQSSFTGTLPSFGLVQVAGAAQLIVVGGTFDGAGGGVEGFGYELISAIGTSKLTLDGVTMKNFQAAAIGASGSSSATPVVVVLKNGTLIDTMGTADNCASGGSVILGQNVDLTLDASEIKNAKTAGICVRNGVASHVHVALQNGAKLTNDVNGIRSEPGTASEMTLVVNGATFTSNISAGIYFEGSGSLDLTSATMTGNANGIAMFSGQPLSIKARNSTFANNTISGVSLTTLGPLTLDLGTAGSLGKNTLTGNTTTDLRLDVPAAQTHSAVGNTWNPSVQSADAAGKYTAGTDVVGPMSGTNYTLVNPSTLSL